MCTVRNYECKDYNNIKSICLGQSFTDGSNKDFEEAIFCVFAQYFIEREQKSCFILADSQDKAVGYVLCTPDFKRWKEDIAKHYCKNNIAKAMNDSIIKLMGSCSEKYPAHMHIDIAEKYQGKGFGTKLMKTLINYLRDNKIKGLCLSVSKDNPNAHRFYLKNGFELISEDERQTLLGYKI